MRYSKGSFITVPNKDALRGLDAAAQCLYMWLCHYANTDGECFPSRRRLCEDTGLSVRSLDAKITILLDVGLITKTNRSTDAGDKDTNLYSIPLLEVGQELQGVEQNLPEGSAKFAPPGRAKFAHRTQSNIELNPLNSTAPQSDAKIIGEIIDLFKEVNPSYQRLFGSPPQRAAVSRLLKIHGPDKLKSMIAFLPKSNASRFAPTITTPAQFEQRLGDLIAWSQKQKAPTKEYKVAFT